MQIQHSIHNTHRIICQIMLCHRCFLDLNVGDQNTFRHGHEAELSIIFSLLCSSRLSSKIRSLNSVEITPVNGDSSSSPFDIKKTLGASSPGASAGKGSKLESALDKLGLGKRKVSSSVQST